jgi:rubrerythrin
MSTTRRELVLGAGALAGGGALAGAARAAEDPARARARRAVRAALQAEQATAVAFEAIANSDLIGDDEVETMRALLDHARAHASALEDLYEAQTGEDPPLPPTRTKIPGLDALSSRREALELSLRLEEEAIARYLDAIRLYRNTAMLRLIAGAMGTDAQHLVLLRELLGREPVPAPFERGA